MTKTSFEYMTMDKDRALQLWREGMTDTEIADDLGIRSATVRRWRNASWLEPNVKKKRKKVKLMSKLAQDAAAAKEMGVSYGQYKAITYWPRQMVLLQKKAEIAEKKRQQEEKATAKRKAEEAARKAAEEAAKAAEAATIEQKNEKPNPQWGVKGRERLQLEDRLKKFMKSTEKTMFFECKTIGTAHNLRDAAMRITRDKCKVVTHKIGGEVTIEVRKVSA